MCLLDIPSKPSRPTILEQTADHITVTWAPPISDGGSPILRYLVERREIRGPRWIRVHKSMVEEPPFVQSNLYEGAQYEFRVFAQNAIGLSEASEVSSTVTCQVTAGNSTGGDGGLAPNGGQAIIWQMITPFF